MHGIGDAEEAQKILDWVRASEMDGCLPRCVRNGDAPEGWEYIGRGSFRSVWFSPSGVAYKVSHRVTIRNRQSVEEVANLASAWEKEVPEGCRLPKFDKFHIDDELVVAIERIVGDTLYEFVREGNDESDYYERMRDCERRYRLIDLHDENVIIEESTGLLVPVDLGG